MNTFTPEDFNTQGMIVINGFDDTIYNTGLMNLQREIDKASIHTAPRTVNGKKYLYSGKTKITLSKRGARISPMIGTLYLRGINKRSVLWDVVKYSTNSRRLATDSYETYIVTWNNVEYEIGFSKNNASSYMEVYDSNKWSNIYYNNLKRSTHQYGKPEYKSDDDSEKIYGDIATSLGWKYVSQAIEDIDESIAVLEKYSRHPELLEYIKNQLEIIE